jgi:succinyl-CoA synthetase beta subunit
MRVGSLTRIRPTGKDNTPEGWTEHMNLHEYQAKQLFARYGLPAPVGYACTTPREAEEAASKIGAVRG